MKPVLSPYRYVICFCSCLLIFMSVGLLSNAFPIYFPFIMKEHQFSNTQLSLLTTMRSVTALICMFFTDRYYARLNLKSGILLALSCGIISFVIYGTTDSPLLYDIAAAISGICYGLGGVIPASLLIHRWFSEHAASAMGLAASGTGIASILGPILITRMVQSIGLSKTFLTEACLIAAGTLFLLLTVRNEPPAFPEHSDTTSDSTLISAGDDRKAAISADSSESGPQLLFLERLRVTAGFFFVGVIGLTSYSSLSMLFTTTGHSIEEVSSVLALLGGMLILGKCSFGLVSDRFDSSNALICYGLLLLSGQTLCCFSAVSGPLLLRLTLVFFGLGAAIPGVSIPILTADLCSPADYAKTLKNYQITYTLGGLLTSTLPGILADLTGSYLTSHVLFVFCAAGILLFLVPVHKRYTCIRSKRLL